MFMYNNIYASFYKTLGFLCHIFQTKNRHSNIDNSAAAFFNPQLIMALRH
jgi:hypothetical protein